MGGQVTIPFFLLQWAMSVTIWALVLMSLALL